ncbi:hypothetical protein [Streptomyces virginiae]|uniref:Uncharacterized protein n=1 Tax=Streptomyces virginiae TaxID=1961 RepID=A0ABZ1TR21_STRVG|nr:hypothetical protein [Streptomyces virginiae]
MNHLKGSPGRCREALIAYLAALATGIVLVILGVSPSAVITVALGVSVLFEKFSASQREGSRPNTLNQTSPAAPRPAGELTEVNEVTDDDSGDSKQS